MSKVLASQNVLASQQPRSKKTENIKNATPTARTSATEMKVLTQPDASSPSTVDFDDFTTSSSILEFLAKEQECCTDADAESIFQEVSRLADNSDTRSVDEILREAEMLIQQQTFLGGSMGRASEVTIRAHTQPPQPKQPIKQSIKMNAKYTKRIENVRPKTPLHAQAKLVNGHCSPTPTAAPTPGPTSTPTDQLLKTQAMLPNRMLKLNIGNYSNNLLHPTAATPTKILTPVGSSTDVDGQFEAFIDNLPSVSVISEESTPKDLFNMTVTEVSGSLTAHLSRDDDDTDGTDTMEEITEGIETIELMTIEGPTGVHNSSSNEAMTTSVRTQSSHTKCSSALTNRRPSCDALLQQHHKQQQQTQQQQQQHVFASQSQTQLGSPARRAPFNFSPVRLERRNSGSGIRRSSMTTPDSGISQTQSSQSPGPYSPYRAHTTTPSLTVTPTPTPAKTYCNKTVNTSPKRVTSSLTSPIEPVCNISREHALKHEIDLLQEKLKDTEERLQSLRIQHDSLSQLHRDLRESNTRLQDESEMLKLDVQHLNECASILRTELQTARADRNEALEVQKALQGELEEHRQEKKRVQEQKEKDGKTIQDLQRQCREMERILMRKHPDSVSALIVASKNPGKCMNNDQENLSSRKLLEQRIAQLESDAKEQDKKAQQILANVQARFNSVQAKYETHIADLETQVLSLQEINTKLNEKIESQVRTLDYFVAKKSEKFYNQCTQTEPTSLGDSSRLSGGADNTIAAPTNCSSLNSAITTGTQTLAALKSTRDHSTNTIGTSAQHSASSSTSSTANSTPNTSRPNSKQSGIRKPLATAMGNLSLALVSKLPVSQSDSTISSSAYHAAAKEDAHLVATIRGMRVDLAIKDKAVQRLTRELDECKKTIRKLQRDKDALKSQSDKPHWANYNGPVMTRRNNLDAPLSASTDQTPANTEHQALKEAQNKVKLLEADYKQLHEKRLQDLKTLQTAHERELASCHETVRLLQQRLNERDEAFAQKRRKLPVDYYALKAKVSSLERRHSEREERLHMLVEALSKGRLNGALGELLTDNNNQ